jgi:hypothetical protein
VSEFGFTLRLGASELSDEQVARLYDALPESTASARDGRVLVEIDREAHTFADAVVAAILNVEKVIGVPVVEVEPEDLVFASEIAQRTERTKESVSLLAEGRRGPGAFPVPARMVGGHKLWRWGDVMVWFAEYERDEKLERHEAAVVAINAVLAERRAMPLLDKDEAQAVRRLAREREPITA